MVRHSGVVSFKKLSNGTTIRDTSLVVATVYRPTGKDAGSANEAE